ncbi:MAG: hypothetical protein PWP65_948 [Clostridia bacterium]|nr:hypothetical protein [Clostridia bacterium]
MFKRKKKLNLFGAGGPLAGSQKDERMLSNQSQPPLVIQINAPARDKSLGHIFGRTVVGAAAFIANFLEFIIWLALTIAIVLVVVWVVAKQAGMSLPHWLDKFARLLSSFFWRLNNG